MKLERLSVRGVLRFADQLDIDFRDLPPGLIAFVGENGQGKSTALETPLATIFREFPSRSHKELVDYAHDRHSFLESDFAMEGRGLYRARLNLDGVRRASEAVLVHVGPDGTETVLNDGKVSTYGPAVEAVFPPKALLLASAFASQDGTGSFVSCSRAERRALFMDLIGLQRYEQMAQTAKTAAGLVETARGKLLAVRDLLARDTGAEVDADLDARERRLRDNQATTESAREDLKRTIADIEARLATVQDQVAAHAVATQRVQTAERELAFREEAHAALKSALADVGARLIIDAGRLRTALQKTLANLDVRGQKSVATLAAEIKAAEDTRAATIRDIEERIANNRAVLGQAEEIRKAAARLAAIDGAVATSRADEKAWRDTLNGLRLKDSQVATEERDAQVSERDLRRAEQDSALLSAVPCSGAAGFSGCRFLTNAKAAQGRIPALTIEAGKLADIKVRRDALAQDIAAAEQQLAAIASTIAELDREKTQLQSKAKLEASLAAAEARIAELETARTEAHLIAERSRADAEKRFADRAAEIDLALQTAETSTNEGTRDLEIRAASKVEDLTAQIATTETTLARLREQVLQAREDLAQAEAGNTQAAEMQVSLALVRSRWDANTAFLAGLEADLRDVAQQRQALVARRAELSEVEEKLATLATQLVEWQLLAKAFAREGLPTLEIDAAGPTVSSLTNDILAACGWSRFTVDLATQEAKASGKGVKETFEIKVWDSERGGDARDLADLSGGEQVIVNECLTNAIAVYVNTKSAVPIRTCWRDETTGPLGAENAARYPTLLRKVHELGGYHHTLVVTHNQDVAAAADAQIRFSGGQAQIVLPPYAA